MNLCIMSISVVFRKIPWAFDLTENIKSKKLIDELRRIQKKDSHGRLYCRDCGQIITHERERIEIAGSHMHSFINPHGHRYRIGCFRQAPGCLEIGEDTEEYTWFIGYSWKIVLCSSCYRHLGWVFSSVKDGCFFGLVLTNLLYFH